MMRGVTMLNKRAQGISINTIIIAAIALLVLVIVAVIFMYRMGYFTHESTDCKQFRGSCEYGRKCPDGQYKHPTAVCYLDNGDIDRNNACCVRDLV